MSYDVKYIGMDVHKEAIVIAVLNESGKLVMESVIETKASRILQFLHGLRGELHVTWEEGTWAVFPASSAFPVKPPLGYSRDRLKRGRFFTTPPLECRVVELGMGRGVTKAHISSGRTRRTQIANVGIVIGGGSAAHVLESPDANLDNGIKFSRRPKIICKNSWFLFQMEIRRYPVSERSYQGRCR
jgi:hypothetical protein